jgi:aminoglycoside phosphotransferase
MSLPILSSEDSASIDLQPWIVVRTLANTEVEASLWSIDQVGMALAVFSTAERAQQYGNQILNLNPQSTANSAAPTSSWRWLQPSKIELGQVLVAHYRAGLKWIVLDPTENNARRLFSIREVLKSLREHLTQQHPTDRKDC